jgi:RNA polymerase sigma-70 factor (ECF subfamily)
MPPDSHSPSIEDLLAHGSWLQALARKLAHDSGDDASQEVWERTLKTPPRDASSLRGWLTTVLLNRVRSEARASARRRKYEAAAAAEEVSPPLTPEDIHERLELQRLMAGLLLELPEPFREVVYLRFVEGRDSAEIARSLGVPAGTVRWRLSEALDRLRLALDERAKGDRAAWKARFALVGLLDLPGRPARASSMSAAAERAPASYTSPTAAGVDRVAVTTARRSRWLLGSVVVLAAAALFVVRDAIERGDGARLTMRAGAGSHGGLPPVPGDGNPRGLAVGGLGTEDDCPESRPLRQALEDLKRASDPWREPSQVFEEHPENKTLEGEVRQEIESLLRERQEGCDHQVSCRGPVCRLTVLKAVDLPAGTCAFRLSPVFVDRLSSGVNNSTGTAIPGYDPLSRVAYQRTDIHLRFENESGRPVGRADRRPLPALSFDFNRPLPSMRESRFEECVASQQRLQAKLRSLRRWMLEAQPDAVFRASSRDLDLERRVAEWGATLLAVESAALPFHATCRGGVCALAPSDSGPRAIEWDCGAEDPASRRPCRPKAGQTNWAVRIEEGSAAFGRFRPPAKRGPNAPVEPAYLSLSRLEERSWLPPGRAALALFESFDWDAALSACSSSADKGVLQVMLVFPQVEAEQRSRANVDLHVGGHSASERFGACAAEVFRRALDAFQAPGPSAGYVLKLELPAPYSKRPIQERLDRLSALVQRYQRLPWP